MNWQQKAFQSSYLKISMKLCKKTWSIKTRILSSRCISVTLAKLWLTPVDPKIYLRKLRCHSGTSQTSHMMDTKENKRHLRKHQSPESGKFSTCSPQLQNIKHTCACLQKWPWRRCQLFSYDRGIWDFTGRSNSPFSLRYSLSIRYSLKRFGFESSKLIPRLNAMSNRHISKQEKQNLIITKESLASAGKVICCCYS